MRHGFQVTMPEATVGPDGSMLGFRAGYHLFGLIELGLGLERRSDYDANIVTVSLSPGVAAYPVRQSSSVPVTVRLGIAYESQSLSGDPITALEEDGILSDGQAWRLEAEVSRRLPRIGSVKGLDVGFVPVLSFAHRSVTTSQGKIEREQSHLTLMFDGLFDLDVGGMARVVAGPRIGVMDGSFGIGITLGLASGYGVAE